MGHFRKECISFLMTNACNMRCSYCYLGDKKSKPFDPQAKRINLDFAKRGIEDFFDQSRSRHIRFFGEGEPTLEFKRMQEIHAYAKDLTDDLCAELQTNGYFNMEVAKWCAKNLDIVWISMDGIPNIHDRCRKSLNGERTSHILERNIKLLSQNGTIVGIRSTIGSMNIDRQKESIDYFSGIGVKAVFADHLCLPVGNGGNVKMLKNIEEVKPIDYADRFLDAKNYADNIGLFYSNFLCVNFDESVNIACRAMIPVPHLTPSGHVSCCDMATRPGTILDDLIYGEYDENTKAIKYFQDKIEKIRSRDKANIPECQSCDVVNHCAGGCMGEALNETQDFYKVKKNLCEVTKYLAKRMKLDNGLYPFIHP